MDIKDIPTNWRDKYKQAQFRWAIFFVEADARAGGRRVALHEYPKRNVPYAEDMGRTANKWQVQGYLIGKITGSGKRSAPGRFGPGAEDQYFGGPPAPGEPVEEVNYLEMKKNLIECLEQDGPGILRLPLPYMADDVKVMVQSYTVTESRERGGMCQIEMAFVEYGDPHYRNTVSTPGEVQQAAAKVEDSVASTPTETTAAETEPYRDTYDNAEVGNFVPNLDPNQSVTFVPNTDNSQSINSGINY